MKETFSGMLGFGWQDGYAAFTVSKSHRGEVEAYISNQREHHRVKTFEEEYRPFFSGTRSTTRKNTCLIEVSCSTVAPRRDG
jgi:hypothetical protein